MKMIITLLILGVSNITFGNTTIDNDFDYKRMSGNGAIRELDHRRMDESKSSRELEHRKMNRNDII